MSRQACEIKSVREDVIEDVTTNMLSYEEFHKIANLFKVLSDYNRIRIISALNHSELCVCELSLLLDMSQSAISHQLRILRNTDIVKFRKENKQIFYSLLNDEIMNIIKKAKKYE